MSENQFRQSFCALIGAATLVCGTHLFLIETADWNTQTLEVEPPPEAAPTVSINLSTGSKPQGPTAQLDIAPASVRAPQPSPPNGSQDLTASTPGQPPFVAEPVVGDQAPLASENDANSIAP